MTPIFYVFANILGGRQYFMILLDFLLLQVFVYIFSIYYAFVYAPIFWRSCFDLRFKIDIVVMIIWSVVIIINFVLTLYVSTTSLSHNREPCEIKNVFNHTCSLHTCVCARSRRRRVRLSGFRRQGIASLLGVSQVALFRSGSVPNIWYWQNNVGLLTWNIYW